MQVFATGKATALGSALRQTNCFISKSRYAVRIMKLTTILLLAGCLQLSARGLSQTISISVKDAPLLSVLKAIEKQTDFVFIVDNQWLQKTKKVTISAINLPLLKVLELCFKDQPLTYNISGKVIVVSPKEERSKNESSFNEAPPIDVRGRVVNENGEPAQATITVKGTNQGTTTDANGEFRLKDVNENAVLIISGIGIEKQEIKVKGKNDVYLVKIAIKPLDETMVVAYGSTTRRLNTGNVSSVKANDIEKQPVNNPLLALEGRVPGLFIAQNSGVPGGGITVRLQGQNSLNRGSDPLYVIDGVPYISQPLPNLSGPLGILGLNGNTNTFSQGEGGGNPLSFINPADIASIEVLKDADATAIYGSRAANGAILITTKKGKAGKTQVSVNFQNGWGKITRKLPLLNTSQYLEMRHEAQANDNAPVLPTDFDINGTWDTTRYTDWQKVLIGGTAHYTDAGFSVSGGSANTQFLVGSGYHRETTVFPGDLSDQKGSLHFNINHTSANQKFLFQIDGKYLADNNHLIQNDLTRTALNLAPDAPPLYNSDGSLNWAPLPDETSTWVNPLASLQNKYTYKINNLLGNALISYEVLPGLYIKSTAGYTNLQTNETLINPLTAVSPEYRATTLRNSLFGTGNNNSWIVEPQVTFKRHLSKGVLNALAGTTVLQQNSYGYQLLGSGFNSDQVMGDIKSAATISVNQSIASVYRYNALFGRINYNWQNKFIVNLAARRDGSSRFGSKNQLHNFGSVAGAWIFSNEKFFMNELETISYGKIRASYGTTGNDQIGDYQFMNLYNPYSVPAAYQGATGLTPNGLPNPYLQWEETRKLQFGLDLGFLKDRILLNAAYYRNRSSNLLQGYLLPILTGFSNIQINFPATLQNSGWEFSLETKNINSKDFSWSTDFNLTIPRNKLLAFPNLETSTYASIYAIGQPVTIKKVFHVKGVDPSTGLFMFADKSGSTTSGLPSFLTDRTVLKNTDPKFYGGFENTFKYKGFELSFLFQFTKQLALNYALGNYPGVFYSSVFGTTANQPVYVLNRWKKQGDIANAQRFGSSFSSPVYITDIYASFSDWAYSDASYIRLKNLSLSWQWSNRWLKSVGLQMARIYVRGQNLFTITNYKGMDPEQLNLNYLPPLRMLTAGVLITL